MKRLTEKQFEEIEFVDNHLDKLASEGGKMFETYGDELEFVQKMHEEDPRSVWTICDGDVDGVTVYSSGFHFVNRLGYLITKEPYEGDAVYEDEWGKDRCEDCGDDEATFQPCPYASDVDGDHTEVWLCDSCAKERAMDV